MPKVAYVDVDDTLIRSTGTQRLPLPRTIRHVRALKSEGWQLYCWSNGGAAYARETARALGLADCFVGFLPKPDLMIDDTPPDTWNYLTILHPAAIP